MYLQILGITWVFINKMACGGRKRGLQERGAEKNWAKLKHGQLWFTFIYLFNNLLLISSDSPNI